jgi:hypothetical protein
MAAVATRNESAPTASGASRSARSSALTAPWMGRAAPASRPSASQPTPAPGRTRAAEPSAWARTIMAAPVSTATAPASSMTPSESGSTPSQPKPSSASEASIWPAIQSPTVTSAPSRGNSRIPEVM